MYVFILLAFSEIDLLIVHTCQNRDYCLTALFFAIYLRRHSWNEKATQIRSCLDFELLKIHWGLWNGIWIFSYLENVSALRINSFRYPSTSNFNMTVKIKNSKIVRTSQISLKVVLKAKIQQN